MTVPPNNPYAYGAYPPPPPPKKGMPGWAWGLIIGGVVIVLVCCVCGILLVTSDSFQKGFRDGYNQNSSEYRSHGVSSSTLIREM